MWFPVAKEESWFEAVERVLVMNGLAENLCSLEPLRKGSDYNDWRAIYNAKCVSDGAGPVVSGPAVTHSGDVPDAEKHPIPLW